MRRPLLVLLPALLVLALPAPAAAATVKRCAAVIDVGPTGFDPADAVAIRARNVTCRTARRLGARYSGRAGTEDPVVIGRFSCSATSRPDGFSSVVCSRDSTRRVRFVLGNAERRCGNVTIEGSGERVAIFRQGIRCSTALRYARTSSFPDSWHFGTDPFTGNRHAIKSRGRNARVRYAPAGSS